MLTDPLTPAVAALEGIFGDAEAQELIRAVQQSPDNAINLQDPEEIAREYIAMYEEGYFDAH